MQGSSIGDILPSWLFDVDYDDEIDSTPLLQLLEIDLRQIVRTIVWMLVYPWTSLCNLHLVERLPFTEDNHEFWGPFLVVILYGMVLLWGQFKHIPSVLLIWFISSIFLHLVVRLRRPRVLLSLSLAISGYSALPLILVALFDFALRLKGTALSITQLVGVCWSSRSAYLSYCRSLRLESAAGDRPGLLLFPIVLMELYFTSLISSSASN